MDSLYYKEQKAKVTCRLVVHQGWHSNMSVLVNSQLLLRLTKECCTPAQSILHHIKVFFFKKNKKFNNSPKITD